MMQRSPIVPVQLTDKPVLKQTTLSKLPLAFKLIKGETEIRVYNDIDKYILFALLKELKLNAR